MNFTNILLITGLLITLNSKAQNVGKIIFLVPNEKAFVKIDNKVLDLNELNTIELIAGTYHYKISAPKFDVYQDSVIVKSGETTKVKCILKKYTLVYKQYYEELQSYNARKSRRKLFTIAGTGILLGNFIFSKSIITEQKETAFQAKQFYQNDAIDPTAIEFYREDYEREIKKYRSSIDFANARTVAISTALFSYIYFSFMHSKRIKTNKRFEPKYEFKNTFIIQNLKFRNDNKGKHIAIQVNF